MNITWISSTSLSRYNDFYKYAIDTWNYLPGNKIIFSEDEISLPKFIRCLNINDLIKDKEYRWLSKERPAKANRFWYKGLSIFYSVKHKIDEIVIWIDADIVVKKPFPISKIDTKGFPLSLMEFEHGIHKTRMVESGFQIFDTTHPQIQEIIDYYFNFWESEEIFNLGKPYDNYVSTEVAKKYKFNNLVNGFDTQKKFAENSFLYTDLIDYLDHYIGKGNKIKLRELNEK